jgi:hypothetical protein
MALRKLELSDGRLVLDNAVAGRLATVAPEGVAASMTSSDEGGAIALNIRWTMEKSPGGSTPLQILSLKMGGLLSNAAFVGGRKYELANAEPTRGRKLGFPYTTYYKFRINPPQRYDAAVFAKMPIACWQAESIAFAIVFPKQLMLPTGPAPVFIRVGGAGAGAGFSAAMLREFIVERKTFGWFGMGSKKATHSVNLEEGWSFDASFLLIAADTWVDCIKACHEHFQKGLSPVEPPSAGALAEKLEASLSYYDRVWDAKNCTHVHLPVKNEVRFESVEFKHSHVTDDLAKLVLYRRLIGLGCERLAARENELREKLASGTYCHRLDGAQLWHTTTRFDGSDLRAFTHHGTGFVGFPGGMATTARRLFEYCLRSSDVSLDVMARSATDWLVETQGEKGSWPASLENGSAKTHNGCVASTAEAARALLAAYRNTHNDEYRNAAEAGLEYIARDPSFFECRNYLRDVDYDNSDGLTAEACIHAFLDWYELTGDAPALELAEKWGLYALGWIRPCCLEYYAEPSFDGLSRSITPRIDVWGGLLMARAFFRLSKATGEKNWRDLAWRLFENIARLQERDGGFSETWFLDFPSGLQSIHIEPTFVTDAFVECILDLWEDEEGPLGDNPFFERESSRRPQLQPAEKTIGLVTVSNDRPGFMIDEKVRLVFAFDGAYTLRDKSIRSAYSALRRFAPGRRLLKFVPAIKIIFNRHRVRPVQKSIGTSYSTKILSMTKEDSGAELQTRRFRSPFHDIAFSVVSEGLNPDGFPAADLELTAKTLAGDLRVRQVRIDLEGHYEIISIAEGKSLLVACGGQEYSIEAIDGPVGAILCDGERLAFDISMCSNWNFFGEYRLRLRVTRRPRDRAHARS